MNRGLNMSDERRTREYSLRQLIGKGYDEFWRSKVRYRVIKGSRASKKSYTTAYWIIIHMMGYPQANTLVVRKVADTLRGSCYAMLEKIIYNLGVSHLWKRSVSPLEMEYLPTGQKILFRGLDDPFKLSSVTVAKGVLCWAWFEEAYQITAEQDFEVVDQAIRGRMPDGSGLWKSIIITFNPWNRSHWLRTRFFENEDGTPLNDASILSMTTDYRCNEWIDDADIEKFERMRKRNPRLYEVAGLGHWGAPEGMIYEDWEEREFDWHEVAKLPGIQSAFGLDFGYAADESALSCMLVDNANYTIWIFDELYEKHLTNMQLAKRIISKGYGKEQIIADSAEPKSIIELGEFGLPNVRPSYKFPGSVMNGIQRIMDYHLIIHPRCVNHLTEIQMYAWYVDRNGVTQPKPAPDSIDHTMSSMRYGMEGVDMGGGGFIGDTEHGPDDFNTPVDNVPKGRGLLPKHEEEPEEDSGGWCFST